MPFLVVLALMIGGIVIRAGGWILIGIVMVFWRGCSRLTRLTSSGLMRSAILYSSPPASPDPAPSPGLTLLFDNVSHFS